MRFFLSCNEELRRPIVDRTRPKTRAAKPRVLLLVNLSLLVGLGRCRVEWLLWECFGDAISLYRAFSHDVTAAILVFQNNKTAAMLVYQTSPVRIELFSYVNAFFRSNKFV